MACPCPQPARPTLAALHMRDMHMWPAAPPLRRGRRRRWARGVRSSGCLAAAAPAVARKRKCASLALPPRAAATPRCDGRAALRTARAACRPAACPRCACPRAWGQPTTAPAPGLLHAPRGCRRLEQSSIQRACTPERRVEERESSKLEPKGHERHEREREIQQEQSVRQLDSAHAHKACGYSTRLGARTGMSIHRHGRAAAAVPPHHPQGRKSGRKTGWGEKSKKERGGARDGCSRRGCPGARPPPAKMTQAMLRRATNSAEVPLATYALCSHSSPAAGPWPAAAGRLAPRPAHGARMRPGPRRGARSPRTAPPAGPPLVYWGPDGGGRHGSPPTTPTACTHKQPRHESSRRRRPCARAPAAPLQTSAANTHTVYMLLRQTPPTVPARARTAQLPRAPAPAAGAAAASTPTRPMRAQGLHPWGERTGAGWRAEAECAAPSCHRPHRWGARRPGTSGCAAG